MGLAGPSVLIVPAAVPVSAFDRAESRSRGPTETREPFGTYRAAGSRVWNETQCSDVSCGQRGNRAQALDRT